MQNLIKYTSCFTQFEVYDHKFIGGYISQIRKYNRVVSAHPIPKSDYGHLPWEMPYGDLKAEHNNILYIFAKLTGVKVMWRNKVDSEALTLGRTIWIIGETHRCKIFEAIASTWFIGQDEFKNWVKINDRHMSKGHNYRSIRSYTSYLLEQQADMIYVFVKGLLEFKPSSDLRLEGWIKERYKLDYKKYNTDHHEYYHAISAKFHHRRMLL